MKNFYILIAILTSLSAKAQTSYYHHFPDSGALWTVQDWACCWIDCAPPPNPNPMLADYHFTYFLAGDTGLNAQTYQKIYKSAGTGHQHCSVGTYDYWYALNEEYAGCYREDTVSKKVYYIWPSSTQECVLYDFSANIGDTLFNSCFCGNGCIVSDIDSILIGNSYRKQFHIVNSQFTVIEGIGSTAGLLEPFQPFESGGTLLCFAQNGQPLYPDTTTACNKVLASLHELEIDPEVVVTPNPVHKSATIHVSSSFAATECVVFNSRGQIVWRQKVSSGAFEFDRSHLVSGLYFFRVMNEKGAGLAGKFIVD